MKTFLIEYLIKLKYAYRSLKHVRKPHLGDTVMYKNIPCVLIQGVAKPYWDLIPLSEFSKENRRTRWNAVHESLFKQEPLFKRFKQSFFHSYNFYMQNWFMIEFYNRTGKVKKTL